MGNSSKKKENWVFGQNNKRDNLDTRSYLMRVDKIFMLHRYLMHNVMLGCQKNNAWSREKLPNFKYSGIEEMLITEIFSKLWEAKYIYTFYSPEFLAKCDEVSPLHMASPYKPKNLLGCEHRHAFQVFPIDTIFFENLAVATKIYLFQPHANILIE